MAGKSKGGGGGFFWLILGMLLGIAMTLGALMFINAGPLDTAETASGSDPAVVESDAIETKPGSEGAPPVVAVGESGAVEPAALPPPRPAPSSADPDADDQMADDAAAAGMTSRTPRP